MTMMCRLSLNCCAYSSFLRCDFQTYLLLGSNGQAATLGTKSEKAMFYLRRLMLQHFSDILLFRNIFTQPNFSEIFLASVRDVLFYFLVFQKVEKKLKKDYTNLRSNFFPSTRIDLINKEKRLHDVGSSCLGKHHGHVEKTKDRIAIVYCS